MVLEIVYDVATRKPIALQEINREKTDFDIGEGQAFLKLPRGMPKTRIEGLIVSEDLTQIKLDPDPSWWHDPDAVAQAIVDAEEAELAERTVQKASLETSITALSADDEVKEVLRQILALA